MATSSSHTTNSSSLNTNDNERLLLGRDDEPFDFDEDCPCPVYWYEAISATTKDNKQEIELDTVKQFILEVLQ